MEYRVSVLRTVLEAFASVSEADASVWGKVFKGDVAVAVRGE